MDEKRVQRRVQKEYREIYDQHDKKHITAFERQRKRKSRKKARRRRILALSIIFILINVIIYFAPFSKVTMINVHGNKVLTEAAVISESGVEVDKSSFYYLFKWPIKSRMLKSPYISDVVIEKGKGRQVDITVKERQVIFKTNVDEGERVYFADGTYVLNDDAKKIAATTLMPVESQMTFPYEKLAQKLGTVPSEITSQISEIVHAPSNIDQDRYILYMADGNRIFILMENIESHLKWYTYLVKQTGDKRLEFVMEHAGENALFAREYTG